MQLLIKHIESLLPEHDCVVVPGLGGFVQNDISARLSPDAQLFYPSTKEICFNPKLKFNDGLLAQVYQESFGLSFEEANHQIQDAVRDLRKKLDDGKFIRFGKTGTLRLSDGQIVFRPDFKNSFYPDGFGISPFTFPLLNPVKIEEPAVVTETETLPESEQQTGSKRRVERSPKDEFIHIRLQRVRVRQLLTGVAACLFFVLLSRPAGNTSGAQEASMIHNYLLKNNLATVSTLIPLSVQKQHNHEPVNYNGFAAVSGADTSSPRTTTDTTSPEQPKQLATASAPAVSAAVDDTLYYLVISSFSRRVTAERWLNQQGKNSIFANASILDTEGWAMIYTKKYKDRHEAFNDLNKLAVSHPEFAGAWVFSSKND